VTDQTMDVCKIAIKNNTKNIYEVNMRKINLYELFELPKIVYKDNVTSKITRIPNTKNIDDKVTLIMDFLNAKFSVELKNDGTFDKLQDGKTFAVNGEYYITKIDEINYDVYHKKTITTVNEGWFWNDRINQTQQEKIGTIVVV